MSTSHKNLGSLIDPMTKFHELKHIPNKITMDCNYEQTKRKKKLRNLSCTKMESK